MTERNIATEVLDGLREVREYRAGKLTLRTAIASLAKVTRTPNRWHRAFTRTGRDLLANAS